LREIPAVWTDFVKVDAYVELADLVEHMAKEVSRGL
jgi:hypothetical protein